VEIQQLSCVNRGESNKYIYIEKTKKTKKNKFITKYKCEDSDPKYE